MSAVLQPFCDLERNSSAVDTSFMLFPKIADGDRVGFPHTLRVLGMRMFTSLYIDDLNVVAIISFGLICCTS